VRVGLLARRTGNPRDSDPWSWSCGFYPGSHPGEQTSGTAVSLNDARAGFERAWAVFLSNRTETDFQEWRDDRHRLEENLVPVPHITAAGSRPAYIQ
jgi:hypothetical protein